jgi:hypothetical protein
VVEWGTWETVRTLEQEGQTVGGGRVLVGFVVRGRVEEGWRWKGEGDVQSSILSWVSVRFSLVSSCLE